MFLFKIIKAVVVIAVVAALVVFLATLVLGRERVKNIATSLRTAAQQKADELTGERANVQDELESLAESYPKRIADVRSTLKEAQTQASYIERELEHKDAVIALCAKDIAELDALIEQAGVEGIVTFRGTVYGLDEARKLRDRAIRTRDTYLTQHSNLNAELVAAQKQVASLEKELESIKKEQQAFETERDTILREVERLERNQRLIERNKRRVEQTAGIDPQDRKSVV